MRYSKLTRCIMHVMLKQVQPATRLQPQSYSAFRCIGADCEDTCCIGWGVNVDRPIYEAYQRCDDPGVDDVLHRSLHMSCPEAARVVLLNPNPMEFEEKPFEQDGQRLANLGLLDTRSDKYTDKPYQFFREVRGLAIWI